MILLSSADFFSKATFFLKFSRILSECQTVLDPDQDQHSVGPDLDPKLFDILLILIWVKTVCEVYQQTTNVG